MALQACEILQFSDPDMPSAVAKLRLPHPYLTTYYAVPSGKTAGDGTQLLQMHRADNGSGEAPPEPLENDKFYFSEPRPASPASALPPASDNTPWARARRAPSSVFAWDGGAAPQLGQVWLALYTIFTIQPDVESFRLRLQGAGSRALGERLQVSMVAIEHPRGAGQGGPEGEELVVLRSAFWQGAASPFGGRAAWTPWHSEPVAATCDETITTRFPEARVHVRHPRRARKPPPGSVVYSRYIPSLDEHFSLMALDWQNEQHLRLFHSWQNDPRVAKGWKETGTLEHHRDYLRRQHEDAHTLPVLGRFDDVCFSYFEIYWAKEDPVGPHYDAGDFDRGRHSLVGDARFRGEHRVVGWWPSVIHFCFLDDVRTAAVVGEPAAANATVAKYDYLFGLNVDRYIDFPHKRAALVRCSRQRFFQLAPFNVGAGGRIAGISLPFPSRL